MKIYFLLLIIFLINACTLSTSKKNNENMPIKSGSDAIWDILENATFSDWKNEDIKVKLGLPQISFKDKKNPNIEVWIYNHKTTQYQEWAFEFNELSRVISVTYGPSSDNYYDFSLENIKQRWSKYNCENKEKQKLQPGLITTVTYIVCDKDKRYIEYNKHNEVSYITIEK